MEELTQIGQILAAIAALGTAAFGLVDATKLLKGGVSHVGFHHIATGLRPFEALLHKGVGGADWRDLVRAHWINGRGRGEQKAIMRSMIRLGIEETTARALATHFGLDAATLGEAARALSSGEDLSPKEVAVLGRLDALMEIRLDAAYDRAEQEYRNVARGLAGAFAIVLALLGGEIAGAEVGMSLLVGVLAVPLAPVAKDLTSSLSAAVHAAKAAKAA